MEVIKICYKKIICFQTQVLKILFFVKRQKIAKCVEFRKQFPNIL